VKHPRPDISADVGSAMAVNLPAIASGRKERGRGWVEASLETGPLTAEIRTSSPASVHS